MTFIQLPGTYLPYEKQPIALIFRMAMSPLYYLYCPIVQIKNHTGSLL